MTLICPNNSQHKRFIVTGIKEIHDWEVDIYGQLKKDLGCTNTDTSLALYTCKECGKGAQQKFLPPK